MKSQSIDSLKMLFGFALLVLLGGLAVFIALGHVTPESSFGLESIVTALATLAGAFAGWAFKEKHTTEDVPKENQLK